MKAEHQNTTQAQTLADLMNAVCEVPLRQRAAAFSVLHMALISHLSALDSAVPVEAEVERTEVELFKAQSQVYLRALSTYPAATEAWMTMFIRYKRMFETHEFGKPLPPRRTASDPYRPNAELVKYTVR